LAQKAIAAGIPGEQVDGNDVIAVHAATSEALASIRAGHGPRLIEALTYRLGDHTTVDDASRYREDEEVSRHWKEEPVARLRAYLTEHAGWSKDDEQALLGECETKVNLEAEAYLQTSPQPASSIFEYLYEALPSALDEQARAVAARQQRKNDGDG
jgi:pyruvate dehydrogenase E1 component alpha subunit